jgi:hypothetical protein
MISVDDLDKATKGRLDKDDPETARLLEVGLGVCRRYCGWHVHPVLDADVKVLDGRGGLVLRLPTLAMLEAPAEVLELGVAIDPATLDWSPYGRLMKQSGAYWTDRFGAIKVTYKHGFDSAPGFESAVITYIARTSLTVPEGGRQRDAVGPFHYSTVTLEDCSAFSAEEKMNLDFYRLEPYP